MRQNGKGAAFNGVSRIAARKIIVIKRHCSVHSCCSAVTVLGGRVVKRLPLVHALTVENLTHEAIEALARRHDVEAVADDIPIFAFGVPARAKGAVWAQEIPYEPRDLSARVAEVPWGVRRIRAPEVWTKTRGEGVKVAVVDTGIESTHPDLVGRVVGGYSAVGSSFEDENGHGTHVAGIVAASGVPGGVFGVAPRAQLFAVRVLDAAGSGTLSDLIDGLSWTKRSGAHIVNLSLGSPSGHPLLERAIEALRASGMLVVAAAGNSGPELGTVGFPARYKGVIGVGASDPSDEIPAFSSRGAGVDVAAPGVAIRSTWIGGTYRTLTGTSMAAPHVAGASALLWSASPAARTACAALLLTAERLACCSEAAQGRGLVQVESAYTKAKLLW